jgi:spore germination protein GerM
VNRGVRRLAVVAALSLALGVGCGVSTDDQPHEISQSNVPEGFDDQPVTTDPPEGSAQAGEAVSIWLLHDDEGEVRLSRQRRTVPRPPRDAAILEELLLEGPTPDERELNITTAIPSGTRLASAPERVDDGVLVVDLSGAFFEVSGFELRNAYAQVVCTADDIDGVEAVEFELDGRPVGAFDGEGQSSDGPMRCADYEQLMS